MKYENEVNEIIDGMIKMLGLVKGSEDCNMYICLISKQKMSDDLEQGVKNGHTVEFQMKLFKSLFLNA